MVEFGEQLRRAREEKGMTQQTLAEQLYVTRQSVSHWERGDRYPDLITTKKISQILDVGLDDLLSGKDMTKVVEINPVIENKIVNNITIMFFAFVAISRLFTLVHILNNTIPDVGLIYLIKNYPLNAISSLNEILKAIFLVTIFTYGLFQAVKESLSPKKIGTIIVAYFISLFIYSLILEIPHLARNYWNFDFANTLNYYLNVLFRLIQYALGAVAAFLFFIRKNNKKIVAVLLVVICAIRIIYNIRYFICDMGDFDVYQPLNRSVLSITISNLSPVILFCLIIFQVIILYKKRKKIIAKRE